MFQKTTISGDWRDYRVTILGQNMSLCTFQLCLKIKTFIEAKNIVYACKLHLKPRLNGIHILLENILKISLLSTNVRGFHEITKCSIFNTVHDCRQSKIQRIYFPTLTCLNLFQREIKIPIKWPCVKSLYKWNNIHWIDLFKHIQWNLPKLGPLKSGILPILDNSSGPELFSSTLIVEKHSENPDLSIRETGRKLAIF